MAKRKEDKPHAPNQQYTDDDMMDVIAHVASGGNISDGTNPHGITHPTFYNWLDKNEDKRSAYTRAREMWAISHAEKCLTIADGTANDTIVDAKGGERANHEWISRSKLRVDCRLGLAKMFAKRLFGDKEVEQVVATPGFEVQKDSAD